MVGRAMALWLPLCEKWLSHRAVWLPSIGRERLPLDVRGEERWYDTSELLEARVCRRVACLGCTV